VARDEFCAGHQSGGEDSPREIAAHEARTPQEGTPEARPLEIDALERRVVAARLFEQAVGQIEALEPVGGQPGSDQPGLSLGLGENA